MPGGRAGGRYAGDRNGPVQEPRASAQDRPPGPEVIPGSLLGPSLIVAALAFITVLVSTFFLFLWSSAFDSAGAIGVAWLLLSCGSPVVGLAYAMREGALTWR